MRSSISARLGTISLSLVVASFADAADSDQVAAARAACCHQLTYAMSSACASIGKAVDVIELIRKTAEIR